MILTKKGYIDNLDYSKELKTQEEKDNFEQVRKLYYEGEPASQEELQRIIDLMQKFHGITLEIEK